MAYKPIIPSKNKQKTILKNILENPRQSYYR